MIYNNAADTVKLTFPLGQEHHEETIGILSTEGFYAFEERPDSLDAFITPEEYAEVVGRNWQEVLPWLTQAPAEEVIPAKDWNAEWESQFQPVQVRDFCLIRAPFHPAREGVAIDLQIIPKMSFGTGHHETTRLMALQCSHLDFKGSRVLDVGTGTGVLGVLASKLGAREVVGIDIDSWSYENAIENSRLNGIDNLQILLGTVENAPEPCYDILLANINRNVIITDRDAYLRLLCKGGTVVLSGFLREDEEQVRRHFENAGATFLRAEREGNWVSLAFKAS